MGDLKSSIILDLQGNLERQADRFGGALGRFSSRGQRDLGGLRRSMRALGNGLDQLGNRYTALITGAAGLGTLKMVANFDQRLTQLGIDAEISAEAVDNLRKQLFDVARSPDIRVNVDDLLSAVEQVVKDTGDLPFVVKNIRNIGLAMRATAATGADVGGMITELQKLDKAAKPENIMLALDIFNVQGKAGAVAMRDLASIGPKVFSAYAAMRKNVDPATFVRELGAALQTIKGGAGDVRQAATSFEALMRVFGDAERLKMFKQAGIQIFDPKALKEGREELRPINELMAEILAKTKGRATLLDKLIPDAEAARALKVSNLTENLKKYYNVEADGSVTTKDAARNAEELNAVLTSLSTSWKDISTRNVTEPLRDVADTLGSLKPETVDLWFKAGTALVAIGGAAIVGRKLYQGGRGLMTMFGKGGAAAKVAGAAGFGDAIPVYVVNGPASIWPGAGGQNLTRAAQTASLATFASPLMPVAIAAVGATAATMAGKALADYEIKNSSSARLMELRNRHMVLGGGADSYQVRRIDQMLDHRSGEMSGLLRIEIDSPHARAKVSHMQSNNLDLDVDSGQLMRSH